MGDIVRVRANEGCENYTYNTVCSKALEVQKKYDLDNHGLYLYNHLCQGDFCLFDEVGQMYFDIGRGIGYYHSESWVKEKLKKLTRKGIIKRVRLTGWTDGRRISWCYYDPRYNLKDLVGNWQTSVYGAKVQRKIREDDYFAKVTVIGVEGEDGNKVCEYYKKYLESVHNTLYVKFKREFFIAPAETLRDCEIVNSDGTPIKLDSYWTIIGEEPSSVGKDRIGNYMNEFRGSFSRKDYCGLAPLYYGENDVYIKFAIDLN